MTYKASMCLICGKEFTRVSPRQARCSECMDIRCACGKPLKVKLGRLKAKRERMCLECARRGKPAGSRFTDSSTGYVQIKTKRGWVLEHRAVMEQVLGRPLEKTEIVHHVDGNRENNSPENLVLAGSLREHLDTYHKQDLKTPPRHRFGNKKWTAVEHQIFNREAI